ncbi:MAG: HEPN domain-containing protein [Promethearchaeota archaeon]|nr:MAG: HEPN domain-containing protein [Candidatus Lokiarchaeota archaeon]
MLHKEVVDLLIKRSKNFLEIAEQRFKVEDWDLACFNAEQATQLYLKSKILRETGETPRIHSIRKLLALLGKTLKKNVEFDRTRLIILENAYLNTRYFGEESDREEAEDVIKIAKEVIKYVGTL